MIKENTPRCFGCQACVESCPENCISFDKVIGGYFYPRVNHSLCLKCGVCESVCLMEKKVLPEKKYFLGVFSHNDKTILRNSSSGGVSMAIGKIALEKGFVIYGVGYDKNLVARTVGIKNKDELNKIQKSKYVKSNLTGVFKSIKRQLLSNEKILFFGLPCEISALKLFLNNSYSNLITVSLFCGGNLSPLLFKKYLEYLETKYQTKIIDINFRSKEHSSDIYETEIKTTKKVIHVKANDDFYMSILGSKYIRPSCLNCPFDLEEIASNIVIGDLSNLERGNGKNIVFADCIGKAFLEDIQKYGVLDIIDNPNKHYSRNTKKEEPTFEYIESFYSDVMNRSLKQATIKNIIKRKKITSRIYYYLPSFLKSKYAKWKRKH